MELVNSIVEREQKIEDDTYGQGECSMGQIVDEGASDMTGPSVSGQNSDRESLLNGTFLKKFVFSQTQDEMRFTESKLAKVLLHLSQEKSGAEAIVAVQGLPLLIDFLRSRRQSAQISSCIILGRVAKFAPEEALEQAVVPLVELLNSHPSDQGIASREFAAFALGRFANKSDSLSIKIGTSGAPPVLLSIASQSNGKLQVQTVAMQALRELVLFTKGNQKILAQAGGLGAILSLVWSASTRIKCLAAEILSALASLREMRRVIVNQSGIASLVEAVKIGCNASKTRAAHALGLLAFTKRLRRIIVDAGGIPVLIDLFNVGDVTAKLVAGNTLGLLSAHVDHLRLVAQAGAIPLYANLLEGNDPLGKEIAEDAFCILAVSEANAMIICEHLVGIFQSGSIQAKAVAADVIWSLSGYRYPVSVISTSGAVPLIVGLLKDESDEIREKISGTVAQLSCHEYDRQAMAEAGVIEILVELLQDHCEEVKSNVVDALQNFAEDSCFGPDLLEKCPSLLEL